MEFSLFGTRFSRDAAILELMDDLGRASEETGIISMLGGGNPASIPAVNKIWRRRLAEILAKDGEVEALVAQYDAPGGRSSFRKTVASFLNRNFGWPVGPDNIVITAGSQAGFFLLFNLFSGDFPEGRRRKILFPLAPEYIGYADQGLTSGQLVCHKPLVVKESGPFFKYHVDFSDLELGEEIGAVCASRPTNPTGNVLTDDEVKHIAGLARESGIPFLLDNAYGAPFPSILFDSVEPYWDDNTVVSMSLSKLGLPSVRTGILVAPERIARAVASANSILSLTNPGLGQALVQPLLENDALLEISRQVIHPYYLSRRDSTLELISSIFRDRFPYRIHRPQGSIFFWLWFDGLKITSRELYRRLKEKGVLVVSGDAFFFGLPPEEDSWRHRQECVRINYSRSSDELETGLTNIAAVVEEAGST